MGETGLGNIFEKYEDWDRLIQDCQTIEDLSEIEKEKARLAFEFLRVEFGEDFLHRVSQSYHPLFFYYIVNTSPWTRKWIIRFADSLKEMKNNKNYSSLLKRLKDSKMFNDGNSVLEAASKFSKAGFQIIFDQKIEVDGVIKKPDLKIIDSETKEELFIEVTVLGESKSQRDIHFTLTSICNLLMNSAQFMVHRGRLYKALSPKHLKDVLKKIEETIEMVKRENSFQELVIDDVIEIGFAPQNDFEILKKWASERGIDASLCGPRTDGNEIVRIRRAIEKEQRQLPKNQPCLLIIKNNNLFFNQEDIGKTINDLEEEVYEYSQLLAAGIIWGYMPIINEEEDVYLIKDHHEYIKKNKDGVLVEQTIVLFNQYCEQNISSPTLEKVKKSFKM